MSNSECLTCGKKLHSNNNNYWNWEQILKYCSKQCKKDRPVDNTPFTWMTYQAMRLLIKNHGVEKFADKYTLTKKDDKQTTEGV